MKSLFLFSFALLMVACGAPQEEVKEVSEAELNSATALLETGVQPYNPFDFALHQRAGKPFAVFVSAEWCGSCLDQVAEMEMNHSWVPEGQTVLIADFDAEIPFRQKYGVTTRQTGVYFDAEGNHVRSQMGVLFPDILGFLEGDNVANSTVCSGDSANDC